MLNSIDNLLNRVTMYRLVLYYLVGLLVVALGLSAIGYLPFSPSSLIYAVAFITLLCWVANVVSAWIFDVPANVESVYITAFILALIISPEKVLSVQYLGFLACAAVLSQASKYALAIHRKHIFNPAAIAVAITAVVLSQSASWWVGTAVMLPFVLVGGLLMVRKIKKFSLVLSFFAVALATFLWFNVAVGGVSFSGSLQQVFVDSPLFFFAFVMLTEPLTTPPTRGLQVLYGALVGFLFAPQIHVGSVYSTPELALLTGNVFSYLASPKKKLMLTLREKVRLTPTIYNFIFSADTALAFKPGQYLEWTLAHSPSDSRGNRRYFTIASSPTERDVAMGVKFYEPSSRYKVHCSPWSLATGFWLASWLAISRCQRTHRRRACSLQVALASRRSPAWSSFWLTRRSAATLCSCTATVRLRRSRTLRRLTMQLTSSA